MNSQYFNNPEVVSGATKSTDVENKIYEKDLWATRITEIPSNMGMRIAYDGSSNAEYVGFAPRGLAEGSDGWIIQKLAYDGSDNVTSRTIAYGNWTNHASEIYA